MIGRRRVPEIRALEQRLLLQVGVPLQVNPVPLGHPQATRRLDRHQQRGRALVDLVASDHQPRIRLGDHAVALGHGDQLVDGAFDGRGCERIGGSDLAERREQLAHLPPILRRPQSRPGPPGILQQRVLDRRAGETVDDRVARNESIDAVAAVFQVPFHGLAEVRLGFRAREVSQGGGRIRAEDHGDLRAARSDLGGQLADQVLGSLTADDFQDRPSGLGSDPLGHGSRVVVGPSQQSSRDRAGDLELPDTGDGVDGSGHRSTAAVVDGGLGSGGGQLDGRHRPVVRVLDALARLPDTDDDGRPRIKIHSSTIYCAANPGLNAGSK